MTGHLVDANSAVVLKSQILYTIAEVCAVSRIGRTAIFAAIARGDLIARKCGRRTLIHREDLNLWIASFPVTSPKPR